MPVPPLVIPRIPVTSVASETSPVVTAPLAAFSTPVRLLMESDPKKPWVEDAYDEEMLVVEALVNV